MMREPAFSLLEKPIPMPLRGRRVLVLGLGDTGLSVARWVERCGGTPRVADTRQSPPRKTDFKGDLHTGPFGDALLEGVELLCISPGLPLEEPLIVEARQRRIPVVGDVELFAWQNAAKVLAITGTNGKSTVTALTGHLLRSAGPDFCTGRIRDAVLVAAHRPALKGTVDAERPQLVVDPEHVGGLLDVVVDVRDQLVVHEIVDREGTIERATCEVATVVRYRQTRDSAVSVQVMQFFIIAPNSPVLRRENEGGVIWVGSQPGDLAGA